MARLKLLKSAIPMLKTSTARPLAGRGWTSEERASRQERGYGSNWECLRKVILARDCGICQPCKRDGHLHEGTEVDHIVPKAEGGTDDEANLQCICHGRHTEKTREEARRAMARARGKG
jgi:5-methylcytosine-specific restriction protein A